ncbi:9520_t:CDS:2 [Entrophospora sp. SA101]|nr:9520_t:CDS:2 [Entrophospora sp. SA101]
MGYQSDPPHVWPARQQKLTVTLQQTSPGLQQPGPQTGSVDLHGAEHWLSTHSDPPQVWPARQQKLTVPLQQISSDLQQPLPQTGSLD